MPRALKFCLTAGMVGSGSTFIFNVVRELLYLDRPDQVTLYSDEWDAAYDRTRDLVVKSHYGSPSMVYAAIDSRVLPVLSVRHPGDSVCSDIERFSMPFDLALARVRRSLEFAFILRQRTGSLIFRYEDGFTANPETAVSIARFLDISASRETLAGITSKYSAFEVSAYADRVASIPGALSNSDNGDIWCPTTQIHRGHIGKMVSGRWRDLPVEQRIAIADACREYAVPLGYIFDDLAGAGADGNDEKILA